MNSTLLANQPFPCPTNERDIRTYQLRDNNRCEGIKSRLITRTFAKLETVSLKRDTQTAVLPDRLALQVHKRTDISTNNPSPNREIRRVTVREFSRHYWLDNFTLETRGIHSIFHWPSSLLNSLDIPLDDLHAGAQDNYGRFAPVKIGGAVLAHGFHYEFGIFNEEKLLRLISFQIYDDDRNLVFSRADSEQLPQREFLMVEWDGTARGQSLPMGIYNISYEVEVRDRNGTTTANAENEFLHDPSLL